MQTRPLHGLRVVEFGQFIAVPAAAQTLADLGADVIKVEPPRGDAARSTGWTRDAFGPMFTAFNRAKRSVVLDLGTEAGRVAARALALSADVVLQNTRPGTMEKQGLDSASLMAVAPRLIYGQVSGFGRAGADAQRPGLDIAAQAESGMMSINGAGGADPTRVGFAVVDLMTAHAVVTGVLAALVRRGINGGGGLVDVSLIDVAVEALGNIWADYRLSGMLPLRCGNGQPFAAPAADVFATADGMVVISAYTPEHFPRLCRALGHEALVNDARFTSNAMRVANRDELTAALGGLMKGMGTQALCERLSQAGVVVGEVRTLADVAPGQAGVAADLFVEVHAEGRDAVRIPGLSFSLDGVPRTGGRLPGLGEHTEEVLSQLPGVGPTHRSPCGRAR